MKRTLQKTLSLLLTAAMVLNMGLTSVFAEDAYIDASLVTDSGSPLEELCTCEPVDSGELVHGEDCPLYAAPEMSEAVKALIAMVDALPNAADITEENKEASKAAFEAAAMAYEALSEEDKAVFDATEQYTKLMALRDVLYGIATMAGPVTLDISSGQGPINIEKNGYSIDGGALVNHKGAYIITGTAHNADEYKGMSYLTVHGDGTYDITLRDLTIKSGKEKSCAFTIMSNATVNLTLEGTNTLHSASGALRPGLELSQNCTLTITAESTGRLSAEGGAAGIGSTKGRTSGKITINGGTVEALCTYSGPGIGTYEWDRDLGDETGESNIPEEITINGGIVIAKGVSNGAGIGSGNNPSGKITINGGVVIAEGGESATGIGSGSGALGRNEGYIYINNNAVVFATKGKFSQNHIGIYGSGISSKVFKQAGVIFEGKTGVMYGSIAATENFTVPAEHTLTIKKGETLNIPKGLTNNGTIINGGIINGAVSGNQPKRINPAAHDMSSGELTLNADCGSCGGHMVTGTTTTASILVQGGTHNVTLEDVEITQAKGAFEMQNGCTVNLTLLGDNALTSGDYFAGLAVNVGNTLNITEKSTGSLTAVGGRGTAGIGGGYKGIGGTITIKGGTVTATGGSAAAGIGSGNCYGVEPKNAGTISLLGGVVTAIGGEDAAGIGGGRNSQNNNIIIDGGVVFAMGSGRDHIGLGEAAPDVTCTISRNGGIIFEGVLGLLYDTAVSTTFDFTIPSTHTLSVNQDKTLTISSGTTLHNEGQIIQSGTINANGKITGNQPIKPVTTHDISSSDMNLYISCGGTTCIGHTVTGTTTVNRIIVEGGIHNITLNSVSIDVSEIDNTCAFEIKNDATVNLTLTGSNILKSGQNKAGLRVSSDETLVITAASTGFITVTGGRNAAGIGGDNHEYSGTITINAGTINAIGNDNGAGIGGGNGGGGNTISITGGTINATGGSDSAGIGGGPREAKRGGGGGGDINITGGTVTATGDGEGTGIGEGAAAAGERTIVTISDTAVVFATKGDKATNHIGRWRINISNSVTIDGGIVFQGGSGSVYSDFTLQNDFIINPNQSLNINAGKTLTIPNGKTLYNYGTLFLGRGTTLTGNGTLVGDGMFNVLLEESDIVAPDQVYTGNAIEPEIVLSSHTVMEKEFTTVTTGYTKTYENNIDVGEAAVVYTEDSDTPETIKKTFAITQSDTAFTGGVKTYKGESEQSTFTYGEIITVKVTPTATGTAPAIKGRAVPIANQLALFKGDVQLTEPQNVTSGTPLTFAIHTADKQLAIGENTITAKYVAGANMAAHEDSVNVTLKPKPLTAVVTAKVYDGNADFTDAVLTLNTVIGGDIVTATVTGKVEDANVGTGKTFKLESVTITGSDKDCYSLENAAISGTVAIVPATPAVEVTAVKSTSRLREIIGSHDDTLDLTAKITGVTGGTEPIGTVTFQSGATIIAANVAITNGVADYKWQTPPAGTNIVVTAEFAPEENSNYRTVTGMSDAFDIDQVEQKTLKITDIPEKTYGDEAFTLEANGGSGTGVVSYASSNTSVLTISEDQATIVGQGDVIITATKAGDNDYKEATATYEITVGKATPAILWGSNATQTVEYTGAAAILTPPNVTGVSVGVAPSGAISYQHKSTAVRLTNLFGLLEGYASGLPIQVGEYKVVATVAEDGNYLEAASGEMTLTIDKSTPKLAIKDYNGKDYDGKPIAPPTADQMIITGTAYTDVTFAYSANADMSSPLPTAPINADSYYVQAITEEGDNSNEAKSLAVSFTIAKAPLTINGGEVESKQWNGDTTATVNRLIFADLVTGEELVINTDYRVETSDFDTAAVGENKTVIGTAVLIDNAKANNYRLTGDFVNVKGNITLADGPAAPTSGVVDDDANTFDFTVVNGIADVTQYEYNSGTGWTDATAKPIVIGNIAVLEGALQVRVKKTATHEAGKTLSNDIKFTASIEGSVNITGTTTYGETLSATASDTQTGAVLSYEWKSGDTILQAKSTNNTYKIAAAAVGNTITVEVTAANYNDSLTAATAAVQKKSLTVTAAAENKEYDGDMDAAVSCTFGAGEVLSGDNVTVTATGSFSDKNAGDGKTVNIRDFRLDAASEKCYTITVASPTAMANITAKTLTVDDGTLAITKEYDATTTFAAGNAAGALSPENLVQGDTVQVKIDQYGAADNANVGTRTILLGISLAGTDKDNYTVASPYSFTNATITAKDITPTIDAIAPVTYDGTAKEPSLTVIGVGTTLTSGTDYTAVYSNNINAGTNTGSVTVKAAAGGNYTFKDVTKSFTINKGEGSVVGVNVTGSYTANDTTFTYTVASIPGAEYKMDSSAWQDSNAFADIVPLSKHTFSVRMKETANHHAGAAKDGNEVEFVKLSGVAAPTIAYTVSGTTGSKTIAITAVAGAEYQFGNAAWSDANTKLHTTDETVTIGIRMKATATHEAGEAATASVNLAKQEQTAPAAFALTYKANGEADYTVTIPEVAGCEYSFDGTAYNSTRTKTANAGDTVTGYMRKAETDTHNASPSVRAGVTLPMFTVQAVTATPNGGSFTGSVSVTLTSGTSGAEIYYTTDGSNPSRSSTQYTAAFTLTTSTTIKAIAVKNGMTDSNAESFTFTKSSGSTGDGGNRGGGNRGGSSFTTIFNRDKSSSNVDGVTGMVKSNDAAKHTAKAIAESIKANKGTQADVVVRNAKGITPQTLRDMAAAAAKAGGTVQLLADSTVNGKIMARIYIDPLLAGALVNDIQLGVRLDEKSVKYTTDKFSVFDNKLAVISFVHQGELGMQIEVAVKVDLTGLDTNNLHLYSYDKTSNLYYPIAAPAYWIDKNGFLHFKTTRGGDIVITDKPLKLKTPQK